MFSCTELVVLLVFVVYLVKTETYSPVNYNNLSKDKLPKSFSECVDLVVKPNYPKAALQEIQSYCLDGFISIDHTHNWARNFSIDEQNYIRSIFRKVIRDAALFKDHNRRKRDVEVFPVRLRREVRDNYQNWKKYAHNVRRLKFEAISANRRSKYDIIADLHATAIQSAHFGPNFLPWHRLYLIILESALGVPIPYWASSIDNEMEDPTQSILWSEKYFGNGFGFVKTGPFANFQTPIGPLFRNIGSDGGLYSVEGIGRIWAQLRLRQISEPTARESASAEGQHNDVHIWVDGQMNTLETSPHDPVFFTHHGYVDYIWEVFRTLQVQRGVDPTTDTVTPPSNVTLQNITDPAVGLTGYYNNDGYSHMIASMVKYLNTPQCPYCSKSPDLYCDIRKNLCVSVRRNPVEYRGQPEESQQAARDGSIMSGMHKNNPFPLYTRDNRVRMDSVTMNYNQNINRNGNSNNDNRFETANGLMFNINDRQQNGNEYQIASRPLHLRNPIGNYFVLDNKGFASNTDGETVTNNDLFRHGVLIENIGPINTYNRVSHRPSDYVEYRRILTNDPHSNTIPSNHMVQSIYAGQIERGLSNGGPPYFEITRTY